jgi:hypothetical protein
MVVSNGARAVVSTLAGGINAGFNDPATLAVDASGNLFVADFFNQCIRKVTVAVGMLFREECSHA